MLSLFILPFSSTSKVSTSEFIKYLIISHVPSRMLGAEVSEVNKILFLKSKSSERKTYTNNELKQKVTRAVTEMTQRAV